MPTAPAIPTYKLYGESADWPTPELVHCETIAARSSLHDWTIRPHRHADLFQLLYCRQGTVQLALDGTKGTAEGPCLLTVPAMCVHGFVFDRACQGWVLTLPEFALERFLAPEKGVLAHVSQPRVVACERDTKAGCLDDLFEQFANEFVTAEAGRLLALESILGLILVRIARDVLSEGGATQGAEDRGAVRLRRFRELVERHFRQWLPVSAYAAELGVTPAQLNNTCRVQAGQSALGVIHERVLIEAKRNLIYTVMTVSEVAYSLGFSNPAYFTRFFKKRTGRAPSEFRAIRQGRAGPQRGTSDERVDGA